jgi:hypothetical protein
MTALATHDDPTRENDTFSPLRFLGTVIRRDMLLAARRRGDWLTSQFFFVMVVSMFPLGIGPEPEVLRMVGPGVVWVAALLASLLSLPRLFAEDFRDGSLEQMLLSPEPTVLVTLGKGPGALVHLWHSSIADHAAPRRAVFPAWGGHRRTGRLVADRHADPVPARQHRRGP